MTSLSNLFILFTFVLGPTCKGVKSEDTCDDKLSVFPNFEIAKYEGTWFEIFRYQVSNDVGSECATAKYTLMRGQTVSVRNIEITNNTKVKSVDGYMNLLDTESSDAKLTIDFPEQIRDIPYWVLDTDYQTYSLVYSCQIDKSSPTPKNVVSAWIFSRSTLLDGIGMTKVNAAMERANLTWSSMRPMLHTKEACGSASIQRLSIAVLLVSIIYTNLF